MTSSQSARYRSARVAVVVSGWPRLSETFALNELVALARAGLLAAIYPTKDAPTALAQPGHEELQPFVVPLPSGDPFEQATALAHAMRTLVRGLGNWQR